MTLDGNSIGLLLIALVLAAFGVRIWARNRAGRRWWSQAAAVVIVLVLVGLVALLASFWIIPDPEKP
jgi:amino acid transporter